MEFQLSSIVRAKGDTELVQKRLVSVCGVAAIHGNNGSCKSKLSQQGAISVIAVKSGVTQEGLIAQIWMFFVEIPQDWEQRPGISDFFIHIRVICTFFNRNLRVGLLEIIIEAGLAVAHSGSRP